MKGLVIDDSAITRRIIINSLRTIGFTEILEACDGTQALQLCTPDVDVVLTDWNMPGMEGVEVVRNLRSMPELSAIPILLITSRSAKEDVVEAINAGIDGYVVKPFTPDVLQNKIQEALASRGEKTGTDG
jgi:two-component system chemotaxis response regulator CheY